MGECADVGAAQGGKMNVVCKKHCIISAKKFKLLSQIKGNSVNNYGNFCYFMKYLVIL